MLLTKLINMEKRAERQHVPKYDLNDHAQFLTLYPCRNFVGHTIFTSFGHTNRDS